MFTLWRQITDTFSFVFPRQQAQELWDWIYQLESEKFDFMEHMKHQKYEVTAARTITGVKGWSTGGVAPLEVGGGGGFPGFRGGVMRSCPEI